MGIKPFKPPKKGVGPVVNVPTFKEQFTNNIAQRSIQAFIDRRVHQAEEDAYYKMASGIIESLINLREIVKKDRDVLAEWKMDPIGALKLVIQGIEDRHVKGKR